jgi:cytochrome c nitrite reductase small subunit
MTEPSARPQRRLRPWMLLLIGMIGVLSGLSLFTFVYAEGTSYLSNDPNTCMNCHVMRDEFDGWQRGSHHEVAVCNDCHTPHTFVRKWFVKGLNGFHHSFAFTFDTYPDTIRIKEFNADVVQENCIRCHETLVSQIVADAKGEEVRCATCHADVGHSR